MLLTDLADRKAKLSGYQNSRIKGPKISALLSKTGRKGVALAKSPEERTEKDYMRQSTSGLGPAR